MLLCDRAAIVDLLHVKYVVVCEGQNPGIVERTIEAVSGEIGDALSYRYPQPWPYVPEIVRYIAAVTSAYRVVEAITSLVDTEESGDNEWIPLQKQWKYCMDLLDQRQAETFPGRNESRPGGRQRGGDSAQAVL